MSRFDDPRITQMLEGRRAIRTLPFPGCEDQANPPKIGFRILLGDEGDRASVEAQRYIEKIGAKIPIDPEMYDRELIRQQLALCCIDPDSDPKNPRPFFPDADEVRRLDVVIQRALWQCYLDHLDFVDPSVSLTAEQVAELRDRLGKEQSAEAMLSVLDARSLRSLVRSMASARAT